MEVIEMLRDFKMVIFLQKRIEKFKDFMIKSITKKDTKWSVFLLSSSITEEYFQDLINFVGVLQWLK